MSRGRQGQLGCEVDGCALKIRSAGMCSKHLREARERCRILPDLRMRENRPPVETVMCRIDGCGKEAKYRGQALCMAHYLRKWSRGTFDLPERPTRRQQLEAGIVSRDDCWLWGSTVADTGYGRIGTDYVHRIAHEEYIGPIPDGYQVDHLCRVRLCVNPEHLEAVTQQENLRRERQHPHRNESGKWVAA